MTTSQFQTLLDTATTLDQLRTLRGQTGAPKFVSIIKAKSHEAAINEGFTPLTVREDSFYKVCPNTNVNSLNTIEIPSKNRTVTGFGGKSVLCFINDKVRCKKQLVEIYVKAV
jgi:hypothetical protein